MPYNKMKPMACTVGDRVKSHVCWYPLYPESDSTRRQRGKVGKSFPWLRVTAISQDGRLHLYNAFQEKTVLVSPLTVWAVKKPLVDKLADVFEVGVHPV